jgi:hypothetical protein
MENKRLESEQRTLRSKMRESGLIRPCKDRHLAGLKQHVKPVKSKSVSFSQTTLRAIVSPQTGSIFFVVLQSPASAVA